MSARTFVFHMPSGLAGTAIVVAWMRRFALAGLLDERVNQLAREITARVPARDAVGEAAAILGWLHENVRYTGLPFHPEGFQRLCDPSWTLFDAPARSGECASLTTAFAALVMSLSHPVRFRTAGRDPARPYDHEHVYAIDWLPGGWTIADPSYAELPLGHAAPEARVWMDWDLASARPRHAIGGAVILPDCRLGRVERALVLPRRWDGELLPRLEYGYEVLDAADRRRRVAEADLVPWDVVT